MDARTKKIAAACFIGGWIGLSLAIQMRPIFWWVGLLIGAGAAYLAHEFRAVVRAVPRAFERAWERTDAVSDGFVYVATSLVRVVAFWSILVPTGVLILQYYGTWPNGTLPKALFETSLMVHLVVAIVFLLTAFAASAREGMPIRTWNVFAVYGYYLPWLVIQLFRMAIWLLRMVPAGAVFIAVMVKELFFLIHSDERLLCMLDAALGITVGYWYLPHLFFGILGGVVGAVAGVLHFEILSKRVLRLAPLRIP